MKFTDEFFSKKDLGLIDHFCKHGGIVHLPCANQKYLAISPRDGFVAIGFFDDWRTDGFRDAIMAIVSYYLAIDEKAWDEVDPEAWDDEVDPEAWDEMDAGEHRHAMECMSCDTALPRMWSGKIDERGMLEIKTDMGYYEDEGCLMSAHGIDYCIRGWGHGPDIEPDASLILGYGNGEQHAVTEKRWDSFIPVILEHMKSRDYVDIMNLRRKVICDLLETYEEQDGIQLKAISPFGRALMVSVECEEDVYEVRPATDEEVFIEHLYSSHFYYAKHKNNGAVKAIVETRNPDYYY